MKKVLVGNVTSDKRNKTLRVEIQRRFRHPKYGKIVRGKTVCHVHDEDNTAREGDVVEIIESRPYSKLKRWELVRVVEAATDVAVEARKASLADDIIFDSPAAEPSPAPPAEAESSDE